MGWQTFKVKDVCSVEKEKLGKDKLPYVGMEDIESGTGRFLGDSLPKSVASSTFKFSDKHVLYGRLRPYLNKVLVPNFEGHCSSEIFPLKPVHNLDRSFLAYWLRSERVVSAINRTCTGARMPRANVKELLEFDIDIPSIDEQKRIVATLDEAFADIDKARALTERNLENARELFASYLRILFKTRQHRWNLFKFREVCDFVRGPFGGSLKKSSFQTTGYAVYEQQHAINNQFSDIRYFVDKKKFQEMARFQLRPGDLIVSCSGTMGRIAIAPDNLYEGIINQALLRLTPSNKIKSEFLKLWMESPNFQEEIEVRAQGAAIRNMASVKILKELDVPIPNMSEQEEIIKLSESMLVRAESLITNYESKLAALTDLKKSLLQKAFTGELTKAA